MVDALKVRPSCVQTRIEGVVELELGRDGQSRRERSVSRHLYEAILQEACRIECIGGECPPRARGGGEPARTSERRLDYGGGEHRNE